MVTGMAERRVEVSGELVVLHKRLDPVAYGAAIQFLAIEFR